MYTKTHAYKFIDKLFVVLENTDNKFEMIYDTITLINKYFINVDSDRYSYYDIGIASFAITEQIYCESNEINYRLIYQLSVLNSFDWLKTPIYVDNIIQKLGFSVLDYNAYNLIKKYIVDNIVGNHVSLLIEYILGCVLYDNELMLIDPKILIDSVIYFASKWFDKMGWANFKNIILNDIEYIITLNKYAYKIYLIIEYLNKENTHPINNLYEYREIISFIGKIPIYNFNSNHGIVSPRYEMGEVNHMLNNDVLNSIMDTNYEEKYNITKINNKSKINKHFHIRNINTYGINNKISKGIYGNVYNGIHFKTGKKIAIKSQKYNLVAIIEIGILKYLDSEYIIKPYNSFYNKKKLCFAMEYYEHTLLNLIENNKLSEINIITYTEQLLKAILHCHDHGVIHQDIKPRNIMVTSDMQSIKLIDFGLSRPNSYGKVNFLNEVCTYLYRAPELLLGCDTYDNKIDMWSIGCVIGEMINKNIVFNPSDSSDESMLCEIFKNLKPFSWPTITSFPKWNYSYIDLNIRDFIELNTDNTLLINIVKKLLTIYPEARYDAKTILGTYFN